jgi:hypothetical protein
VQTDLQTIYDTIRGKMEQFSPPFTARVTGDGRYELWSEKDLVIEGRKRKEVYFAGVIIQKGYVGFYYMPVYTQPEMQRLFPPELAKLLKGKSCFHVKKLDEQLIEQLDAAMQSGFVLYQERGWV